MLPSANELADGYAVTGFFLLRHVFDRAAWRCRTARTLGATVRSSSARIAPANAQ